MSSEEWFDVVDEKGMPIGRATRAQCHSDPTLIHPVVHVFVINREGHVFLQKRSMNKDTQPGMWDMSVGGHFVPGEIPETAARRETQEELGIRPDTFELLYEYVWRCPRETEYVRTFRVFHPGPFLLQEEEIDDGRFWSPKEISAAIGQGVLTPNFEHEWIRFLEFSA